jgi:hypothetical protein
VIDKTIANLPKRTIDKDNNTLNWKLAYFIIDAIGDKYKANVEFVLEIIRPEDGVCGWYASIQFDLETLDILSNDNGIPPESLKPCSLPQQD